MTTPAKTYDGWAIFDQEGNQVEGTESLSKSHAIKLFSYPALNWPAYRECGYRARRVKIIVEEENKASYRVCKNPEVRGTL